ncbi:MAG: PQQ-binding-like beta-propeller repeat protein [Phycisphaerae bacterium]|nr:PQQ-binding-like beta-propeller repeat protein [Phycisphaerae bacterium]
MGRTAFWFGNGLRVVVIAVAVGCLGADRPGSRCLGDDIGGNTWTQWRGPTRDGRAADRPVWPDDLKGLKEVWRVKLSPSYSGPIVSADRIFVTETRREKEEVVRAFDRATGKQIWSARWDGAMKVPFFARENGDWIRSTPAFDGETLYVAGMRDVLVALSVADGREIWRVNFPEFYKAPLPDFGFVSSPLVIGEFVYVQAGGGFVKLNKHTGEPVWRVLVDGGGMYGSAFSSPVPAHLHGREQILVQTREKLCGVDPDSGKVLWSQVVPSFRGMNILTPTVYADGVFTSTHKNKSFFYATKQGEGDSVVLSELWTNKAQGYMSSPIVRGDHVYLHLGNGRLCCIDLRTGEQRWRSKSFGKYWSMAAQDDKVLALDERGELILWLANPAEFKLLDRRKVADADSWAHVAVCGGQVVVRDLRGLSVFDWSAATKSTP